ncbi:MAG: pantoate--beta-alanine ligase [Bacteroidota bacterium]
MLVIHKIKEIQDIIASEKQKSRTIGFVPTMGALHPGHISLIQFSKQQTDITVCSIFVNPTQFNNTSDLTHYPRTPEADIKLLEEAGCDILYMPDVKDVYPENDTRKFNFGYLDTILEGAHRPGHFNGVGQVVSILLEGIKPHKAFFGSKDYQQVMVVKNLVKQLHLPVEIVACPILRESDGLAMSSRNTRLSAVERQTAALIPKIMNEAKEIALEKGVSAAKFYIARSVSKEPTMKLDYYEICDAESLNVISDITDVKHAVSLIAVFVGNIRLIDNWMIE